MRTRQPWSKAFSLTHDERVRELPSGAVTFLFTDIEGSTKLLRELGRERYTDVLDAHRRLPA